ncbi:MAG: alpha/beta hydrolase fold domain-containing protein [Bdellovibrionales bacterium]|nr:alpha/beta hydrolase fold domain-containing protein [Massilia sp.]
MSQKMAWYRKHRLSGSRQNGDDPRGSPALARLEGLPLVYLNALGRTCLRDDSVLLARRLFAAGVANEFSVVERVTRGFMQTGSEQPQAAAALREAAHFVATILPP